jgi:Ca-activated chloride channel homolog
MNWSKDFSVLEYFLLATFAVVYLYYVFRIVRAARKLGVNAESVVFKFVLRSIYFALLILSLLGPIFGDSTKLNQTTARDIFLAIDVSKSMDAKDISPSRIEKIKFELWKTLEKINADRFGIIIFSTEAFVHLPLTFDKESQRIFLNSINTNLISESGTNLNSVFELMLKKVDAEKSKKKKSRGLVLITDGEDFGQINDQLLKKLNEAKIKTIVVGIGTQAGVKLGDEGESISRLNGTFLRNLSQKLKAEYLEFSRYDANYDTIYDAIERIEDSTIDKRNFYVSANKYRYFLILALVLLFIDVLWIVRTMKL